MSGGLKSRIKSSRDYPVYSGVDSLPEGRASDEITEGCLVLEGGAFRAVYGEGVLDALMEENLNFQCTVGVSAGALNGFNYVSGEIGRAARINLRYRHDPRYTGMQAIARNKSVIGFDFIFSPEKLGMPLDYKRFYDPSRRFVAVATSMLTGEAIYFEKGSCDIFTAVQASASMPYVSSPVRVAGIPCLDGGCRVKVPFQWALDQNFSRVIVVRTREMAYRRDENGASDRMAKKYYRKYPEFAEIMSDSSARANRDVEEMAELAASGRIFLIAPSRPVDAGRMEPDMEKLGYLYYLGYTDAKRRIPALRAWLKTH